MTFNLLFDIQGVVEIIVGEIIVKPPYEDLLHVGPRPSASSPSTPSRP